MYSSYICTTSRLTNDLLLLLYLLFIIYCLLLIAGLAGWSRSKIYQTNINHHLNTRYVVIASTSTRSTHYSTTSQYIVCSSYYYYYQVTRQLVLASIMHTAYIQDESSCSTKERRQPLLVYSYYVIYHEPRTAPHCYILYVLRTTYSTFYVLHYIPHPTSYHQC